MMSSEPLHWGRLAWPDVPGALAACGHSVIWPFGATEQHGPHLGLWTDTMIAECLCGEVSSRTRIPVLPALPIGMSSGHSRKWPGTLSLTPSTLAHIVSEVGEWLYSCGVRRLFLVNAHVTNAAPLRCGLEVLRDRLPGLMISLINTAEISSRVRSAFFADGDDWHANSAETSLMLHLDPESVYPARIEDDPDRTRGLQFAHSVNRTSSNGVTGTPSLGTAPDGKALFSMMVDDLSERILAGSAETPPLES